MNCLKCGRETVDGQVFCNDCLEEMEKYPVKPGIAIKLPYRREEPAAKKTHQRKKAAPSSEEQVKTLRKVIRRLIGAIAILLVLLLVTGYFTVFHLLETRDVFLPGQNYSAISSVESTGTN